MKTSKGKTAILSLEKMEELYNLGTPTEYGFLPVLCTIVAEHSTFYPTIDKLYEPIHAKAHHYAKESDYYDFYFFKNGSLEKEYYAKRTLGICLYSLFEKDPSVFQTLFLAIKGKWYKGYRVVEQAEVLDIETLSAFSKEYSLSDQPKLELSMLTLVQRLHGKQDIQIQNFQQPHNLVYAYAIMSAFFACFLGKEHDVIIGEQFKNLLKGLLGSITDRTKRKEQFQKQLFAEQSKKELTNTRKKLTQTQYFTEWEEYIDENFEIHHTNRREHLLPITKILRLLSYIAKQTDYRIPIIESYPDSKKQFERDVEEFTALNDLGEEKELANSFLVYIGLVFKIIILESKRNKDFFFTNNNMSEQEELEKKDYQIELLQQENEALKNKLKQLEKEKEDHEKNKKEEFTNNIITLRKEKIQLEQKQEDMKKEFQEKEGELYFLREWKFALEKKEQKKLHLSYEQFGSVEDFQEKLDYIASKKVIIVGGHVDWKNKIKDKLPSVYFVDRYSAFDDKAIKNADIVLYMTSFMNHPLYYGVRKKTKRFEIAEDYLVKQNTDLAILEIYDDIIANLEEIEEKQKVEK